jgi:hypothetical protein
MGWPFHAPLPCTNNGLCVPKTQIRRMVETSLEAVAFCGASLLFGTFTPVPYGLSDISACETDLAA